MQAVFLQRLVYPSLLGLAVGWRTTRLEYRAYSRRGKTGDVEHYPWWNDVLVVVAGCAAYGLVLWLHPLLFGVAVI